MDVSDSLIELGTLAAYLVVLLWIGVRSARGVKTSADYTLAGRSIPWVIVLATTAATMIGGGASVGMVAGVAEVGIAAALITCAWHLQLIFTGLFVAPKLRGLNLVTVGDYIHLKYGPLAREVSVASCLLFLIGGLAAQMAAIGAVANSILDLDYRTAMLIGAAVTVFYSTVGGISAVVKTDVLQFVILVAGIGTASAIVAFDHGGISAMAADLPEQFSVTSHWSPMQTVSLFFAFLLGETFVPVYTVRCFIARDSRQARWGVAGAGIFLLLFMPIATLILGTGARLDANVGAALAEEKQDILLAAAENGETVTPDEAERKSLQIAFPTLVRSRFPPVLAGVVIAAIIAAVMSSADSCLSCLSTVVMEDLYRRHVRPGATDRQLLRVAQWASLLAGVAATVCAWYFRNVADILVFVYDFWAPTMILPFLVAVFWYRETRVCAVVVSMICGAVASVVWRFVLKSPGDVGPALFGVGVAVAAYCVTLPFTRRAPTHRLLQPSTDEP